MGLTLASETYNCIQGKQLIVSRISLESIDNKNNLVMTVHFEKTNYFLEFQNVSSFSIRDITFPIVFEGLQIIDNLSRGWQNDLRYHVYDYEQNQISFYCEHIEVRKNGIDTD